MVPNSFPASRQDELVVQQILNEILIYDLKTDKAFCLNETSALVWQECDGKKSISEITRSISRKTKSPVAEDLVWLALDQFKQENLLSNADEIVTNYNGLSRREAIRKVGLTALIALPVISSLVAPTAAQAQSLTCIAVGDDCSGATIPCCSPGVCINVSGVSLCGIISA